MVFGPRIELLTIDHFSIINLILYPVGLASILKHNVHSPVSHLFVQVLLFAWNALPISLSHGRVIQHHFFCEVSPGPGRFVPSCVPIEIFFPFPKRNFILCFMSSLPAAL